MIPFNVSVFWGLFWDVMWLTACLIQHIPVRNMFWVRAILSPPQFRSITDAWQRTKGARKAGCNICSPSAPGRLLGVQTRVEASPDSRCCSKLQEGGPLSWGIFKYSLELFRKAFFPWAWISDFCPTNLITAGKRNLENCMRKDVPQIGCLQLLGFVHLLWSSSLLHTYKSLLSLGTSVKD